MPYIQLIQPVILLLILAIFSCESSIDPGAHNEQPDEERTYSFLALGDSYSIGQGVEESLRWPVQLSDRLENSGYTIQETKIIARTGWTTRDLIDAIKKEDPGNFDLISLLIGVNNQYQGKPFIQFESELDTLIETALRLSGDKKRVFIVSIPDYGVTPFGRSNREIIAWELDQYNMTTKMKCEELGIPYINITGISRSLGNSTGALASDSLHPSGLQYMKWIDSIHPVAVKLLKQ